MQPMKAFIDLTEGRDKTNYKGFKPPTALPVEELKRKSETSPPFPIERKGANMNGKLNRKVSYGNLKAKVDDKINATGNVKRVLPSLDVKIDTSHYTERSYNVLKDVYHFSSFMCARSFTLIHFNCLPLFRLTFFFLFFVFVFIIPQAWTT
jgi:hypothetical protein